MTCRGHSGDLWQCPDDHLTHRPPLTVLSCFFFGTGKGTEEALEKSLQDGASELGPRCWEATAQVERTGSVVKLRLHRGPETPVCVGVGMGGLSIPKAMPEGEGKAESEQDCVAWSLGLELVSAVLG